MACVLYSVVVLTSVLITIQCQQFGFNNLYACHCRDNVPCNIQTGNCFTGCGIGWFGPSCQKQNVAYNKRAVQSGKEGEQGPRFAIDSDRRTDNYKYCIDTNYSPYAWWRVDLDDTFPIRYIGIYYRKTREDKFKGYSLEIIKETTETTSCYQHDGNSDIPTISEVTCNDYGRYINISNNKPQAPPKTNFLSLCEVEVYVCSSGTFGKECERYCHCLDSKRCDQDTGKCSTIGCLPGWYGEACDTSCESKEAYGLNCTNRCSERNCNGSNLCNHVNGTCVDGCQVGYFGEDCVKECAFNSYGMNCSMKCDNRKCESNGCHHVTGKCDNGCLPGYKEDDCSKECDKGYYGNKCNSSCSDRLCLTNTSSCHHEHGACDVGCVDSFTGRDCTVKKQEGDNTAVIVVSVILVIGVLVVTVIGYIIWRRRVIANKEKEELSNMENKQTTHTFNNDRNIYENSHIVMPPTPDSLRMDDNMETDDDISDDEAETNGYYNLPPSRQSLEALEAYTYNTKQENGFKCIFSLLPNDFTAKYTSALKPENKGKCRYKGYVPYDHSRVVLQKSSKDNNSDFINANYINKFGQTKAYIAAQGASQVTVNDFVRMIWEQRCDKVIMLTNLREMGKAKCEQYWPLKDSTRFGDITLTLGEECIRANYTTRKITMSKGDQKFKFCQFHYTAWPDHNVPNIYNLLNFLYTVNNYKPESVRPQIVHCSAGVGRTGTYIAIDSCIKEGKQNGQIDIIGFIKTMRLARKGMIQTASQLQFVYEALVDWFKIDKTSLGTDEFEFDFNKKRVDQVKAGKLNIEQQFNQLVSIICVDEFEAKVTIDDGIAVYQFPSWTTNKGYFFESLQKFNMESIWQTVFDRHTSTVVFITDNTYRTSLYPKVSSQEYAGDLVLENIKENTISEDIKMISMNVKEEKQLLNVKVFVLDIGDTKPMDFNYISQLIQQLSIHHNTYDPITMFSSKLKYAKLLCILRNVAQRITLDGEVEIFNVVREMHQLLGKTITTQDEYNSLYEFAVNYIKSNNQYANLR